VKVQAPGWSQRLWRNPTARLGAIALAVLYGTAIFAGFLAPYGPTDALRDSAMLPPSRVYWRDRQGQWLGPHVYPTRQGAVDLNTGARALLEDFDQPSPIRLGVNGRLWGTIGPGRWYVLGTDDQGYDRLSRLLYGSRVSLLVGLVGTAITYTLGCLIGAVAGYAGGWVDTVLMRLVENVMSVPTIYLLAALAAVLPVQISNTQRFVGIVAIISLLGWAGLARVVRGQVLAIKEEPFVAAAQVMGASPFRIIWRHILPQTASYLAISATRAIPGFMEAEATLSLIGLGIQPPDPSWGNMLSAATNASVLVLQPWAIAAPAGALVLVVLCFNLVGDGLRDALDPRERPRSR